MSPRNASLAIAAGLAVFGTAPAWTSRNLGTPPGHRFASVQGSLVNAHGAAVAVGCEHCGTAKQRNQAFVWQKGKRADLVYQGTSDVNPVAIDAVGDVVGAVGNRAVRWRKGKAQLLGAFVPEAMSSTGDLVVGESSGGVGQAFVWNSGTLTPLPGLGGSGSEAIAVNDSGTVVGSAMLPSGAEHAVVWRDGQPTDLGVPSGLGSTATFVSANGTIFGFAFQGASVAGVLEWKNGTMVDLGTFGAPAAQPIAMNARGDVLVSTETPDQESIGLRLLRDGKTIVVKVPKLGHVYGTGLDNEDDVVGYGLTAQRGFLWRKGHVTLLPTGESPVGIAGGWIIASNGLTDRAVLLRTRR